MKGIILAAGRGSRMLGHTERNPKCMVELAGEPLLHWQLLALRSSGITDIAVVGGYKADMLREYSASTEPFTVLENKAWNQGNMVSSLLCAAPWAQEEECIVSYSDILYPTAHVRALFPRQEPLSLTYDTQWEALWSLRFVDPLDDAETFREENGLLLEIGGKTRNPADICGQYMGLFKLRPQGWQAVQALCARSKIAVSKLDVTALLRLALADGLPIGAVPVAGQWCEVDSGADLALYQKQLAKEKPWSHNWHTTFMKP